MKISRYIHATFFAIFILLSFQAYAVPNAAASDTVITGKVKSKIALDPTISVFKVDVSTSNGVVMLSGTVNSDTDASALIEIAQSTDGVKDVDTGNLAIKNSSQPFTDTVITAKVKGVLIREKLLGKDVPAVNVSVETNNGVVYLSGNVDTNLQATNAANLAKSVDGVKQVESRLKVGKGN
ncbi:MAG: BON domain-containing protein [Gammaproteobacteria bacterium]|nr:BON domain-containing protein [Gammaproteobacteria bacterium]